MAETIIHVRNLSKQYRIDNKSRMLRQDFFGVIKDVLGAAQDEATRGKFFLALNDISFDVRAGESVALIGKNGSGKTTLIRLMANIMRPTAGTVEVRGRYAALIGLGTGFIPKMSGYQNIYLNAAMYGVTPDEVDEIIDEIIAFADIGDFIEAPIKSYSTGMRARLGFSVAAHILPDVVFIDESLSVGDLAFREKCNDKIDSLVRDQGTTLVFVSHALKDVLRLCQRAIWIHEGDMRMDDTVEKVVQAYRQFSRAQSAGPNPQRAESNP